MKHELSPEVQRQQMCMDLTDRWDEFNMELVCDRKMDLDEFRKLFLDTWHYFMTQEAEEAKLTRDGAALLTAIVPITAQTDYPSGVSDYTSDACTTYARGLIRSVCKPELGYGYHLKDGWMRYQPYYNCDCYQHIDSFAEILRTARAEDEDDWQIQYWRIKQYDLKAIDSFQWYGSEDYTFLADPHGEIQYFIHGQNADKTPYGQAEAAFGRTSDRLSLPAPYQPGDILEIDCRPYQHGPVYGILLTADNPDCAAQYLYQTAHATSKIVALDQVKYENTDLFPQSYLAAIYHVRRHSGELPENCGWMRALSSKIQSEPSFGETIARLKNTFRFCPIKHVKRSEMN